MLTNSGVSNSLSPHEQADPEQQDAGVEGAAPAPCEERLVRQHRRQQCNRTGAEAQSDRKSNLWKAGVKTAASWRSILKCHQHGAAPLAAHGEALRQAKHSHHDRCRDADRSVGRHQPDQERRCAHHRQGQHQQRLAADPVAEMTEECAANRARAGSRPRMWRRQAAATTTGSSAGKYSLLKMRPASEVYRNEVVPLDGGADQAGGGSQPNGVQTLALVRWGCAEAIEASRAMLFPLLR